MLLMLKVATFSGSLSIPVAAGFAATNRRRHPGELEKSQQFLVALMLQC